MLLEASGIAASVNPSTLTPAQEDSQRHGKSACEEAHADAGAQPRPAFAIAAHTLRGRALFQARRRHHYYERFHTSSFASDITEGDVTAGEDPVVRQAAIDALGNMNGTVVAIEPTSGRVLAMVNQRLALSSGAQPCSTIKLSVALAALSEGVIDEQTRSFAWRPQPHESHRGAGAFEQRVFRSGRTQAWIRKGAVLRPPVRTRRTRRLSHSRRAAGHLSGRRNSCETRRRGQDVLVRRRHFDDSAATGRAGHGDLERRHALLPATSDQPRGGRQFSAARQAPSRY